MTLPALDDSKSQGLSFLMTAVPVMRLRIIGAAGSTDHQLVAQAKEAKAMTDSLVFIETMLAQSALQQSGYYHGPVDGNLSKSARQALMGFQKDDGLEVTGELDDELLRRLMALRQRRRIPLMIFQCA